MSRRLAMLTASRQSAQLLRYLLVGGLTNSCCYLMFLLLSSAGAPPKTAMTLVYIGGAVGGFIGNRRWTFRHGGQDVRVAFYYFLAHSSGYALNLGLLYVFVDRLCYPQSWVQLGAMVVVALVLFVEFKYLVFRRKTSMDVH